jgi:hypothetical protein
LSTKGEPGDKVKALLPLSLLVLSGCGFGGMSETSSGPSVAPSTTHGTGGSSGSGGSSGGGTTSPSPPPPSATPVDPTGIWDIVDTVNGKPVSEVALIAGGKYYAVASADQFGCADITGGTYAIDGSMFMGNGVALLMNNCTGPTGQSGYVPYTLDGYLLNTELNLSFEVGGMLIPTLGATMDKLYSEPSSLAKLAGNWNDAGNTLTINPDGTFFEQQGSGCVINGAYTIIDATHNLYGVSFEITNCTSSIAGIAFNGLGYLDDSNPNAPRFVEDVSGPDAGNTGGSVLVSESITPQ